MRIDVFGSYLQAQAGFPQKARQPQLGITISREVGAGGRTIVQLLGQQLAAAEKTQDSTPWAVFDANLAKEVLKDHKLPPNLERVMTEDARLPVEAIVGEVRRYFNAKIDDPALYDVTLNTGRLGFARAAEAIAQMALQHHRAFAEHEQTKLIG